MVAPGNCTRHAVFMFDSVQLPGDLIINLITMVQLIIQGFSIGTEVLSVN